MRVARLARSLGLGLAGLLGLLALGLAGWSLVPAATAPIAGERSIASLERIPLGGFEQAVLLRGHDVSNPVLLYVHGGPGFAHLPLAPFTSGELERHFVVVHWDQRGAGGSCPSRDMDTASLTEERIVADAIELAEQLRERFAGAPLFLVGHSWGSVVGALAAQQRPDLFAAYVGVGQLVDGHRNEELSHLFTVEEARRRGNVEALEELEAAQPPYRSFEELSVQRGWLAEYRGSLWAIDRARAALPAALFGREYTLAERLRFPTCFRRSIERLWGGLDDFDAMARIPRLAVPVFFFTGRHDWNTPYPLVEEWAERLEAPHVEIVWFDEAGHVPPLEAPEAFQRALVEKLTPLARR